MEKIKKMLSLLLAMAMLAALLPCAAFASETASGTCGKNLTWVLDEDGTLTIRGTGKMTDWWLSSNAPWYSSRFLIKAVIIEQGVTSIGNCAFRNCSSITNVTIPNSVSSIGYSVFDGCKSLTNMTIPNSVSSIGSSVFSGCSSLTSVDIPDGVTSIGSSAFYGCSSLTSVDIPTDVTSIGGSAFYGTAYYNDATNWEDEVLYIGNYLIKASTSIFGDYAIKDGTTCIADSAFEGCSNLTDVTIPGSVTSIGGYVFYNCSNLTNVDIPGSVTSMGGYVFYNCSSLTNVDIPGSVTSIGERVFYNCSSLINADISNGVASIGYSAFYGCSSLTSITIPNSVTSIGNLSFYGCNNLKTAGPIGGDYNFELGWSEAIPSGVFKSCSSLTSVTILDGVTSIGGSAFFNCSSLTSITIPNSITSIGDSAFKDCSSLTDIYYAGSKEEWSKISIGKDNECAMLAAIHCSDGDAKTIIAQGNCGSEAVWRIENDGTLTISGTGKMKNYYSYSGLPWYSKSNAIKTVVIEDGITNIGRCAFGGCSNLTSVTIPESVTYIEKDAFADCNSLTDVYYGGSKYYWNAIPVYGGNDRLTEAAIHCSDGDAVLISWTIDSDGKLTISGIGQMCDYVYSDFSSYDAPWYSERYNIKTAVIEDGITGIGNNAFSGCGSLASITIPKSVTDIGEYSFSGCNSLKDIYYAGSREEWSKISIGKNNECALLAAIHCNDGDVKTVIDSGTWFNDGTWTFESGYVMTISGAGKIFYGSWNSRENSVKKVVIEDGVTSIGDNVFGSFKNLNSITIADSVTSIGENSFLDRAVTICAHEGSYAQKYAENNGIKFESLGKMDIESCYVTNVDELIGAIASNREIILADGTYVLVGTDYNDSFQSNVDTLRISNVNYLTIKAEHAGMAEIISSDVNSGEYSQPTIAFDNCYEIKLEGLRIGRTHYTQYNGAVLFGGDVSESETKGYGVYMSGRCLTIDNCDIYGNAVGIIFSGEGLTVKDSIIRRSGSSAVNVNGSEIKFTNTLFSENGAHNENKSLISEQCDKDDIKYENSTFINNFNQSFSNAVAAPPEECISADNAWDGGTPGNYGVCKNGITWQIETGSNNEKLLVLGKAVESKKTGRDIFKKESEQGEVLPYTVYALPWRLLTYDRIVCENAVTYDGVETGILGERVFSDYVRGSSELHIYGEGNMFRLSSNQYDLSWYNWGADIDSVIIEDGITSMADGIFNDTAFYKNDANWKDGALYAGNYLLDTKNLSGEYIVKAGTKVIADGAFSGCKDLKKVTIPESVMYMGFLPEIPGGSHYSVGTFTGCSGLEEVVINANIDTLAYGTFERCENLKKVTLPESLKLIRRYAFSGCNNLQEIRFGGTEEQWNRVNIEVWNEPINNADIYGVDFEKISPIFRYEIVDGNAEITSIKNTAEIVVIPEEIDGYRVTSIGKAFANNTKIKSVTLPSGITSVDGFTGCTNLEEIIWSDTVTNVYGLEDTKLYNTESNWENGALYVNNCLIEVKGVDGEYRVKDGTRLIADGAFQSCKSLTEITIPDSVKYMNTGELFYKCYALKTINLPGNATEDMMHYSMCGLERINIEENDNYVSVDGVIYTKDMKTLVACPCARSGYYAVAKGTEAIGSQGFYNCSDLTSITLPDGVKSIGDFAFWGCERTTSIALPKSLNQIGDSAFYWCDSITDVYYTGSEGEWKDISIDNYNDCLLNAVIHYNSSAPSVIIVESGELEDGTVWTLTSNNVFTVIASGDTKYTPIAIGYSKDGEVKSRAVVRDGKAEISTEDVKTVKIFIWESIESMKPLGEAKVIKIK